MKWDVIFQPRPAFERLHDPHDELRSVALFLEPLMHALSCVEAGWESKVIKGNVVYIDHINKVRPACPISFDKPATKCTRFDKL